MTTRAHLKGIKTMKLPINAVLVIVVYTMGRSAQVNLTLGTRIGDGRVQIQQQQFPDIALDSQQTFNVQVLADELEFFALYAVGAPTDGIIMATVSLAWPISGAVNQKVLLSSGAVYTEPVHSWAGHQLNTGLDIQYPQFFMTIANPAAATDATFQAPFGGVIPEIITYTLTTSIVVANRTPRIIWTGQSAAAIATVNSTTFVTAALAANINWLKIGSPLIQNSAQQTLPIPEIRIEQGGSLTIGWTGKDALDQLSNIRVGMRAFPPLGTP